MRKRAKFNLILILLFHFSLLCSCSEKSKRENLLDDFVVDLTNHTSREQMLIKYYKMDKSHEIFYDEKYFNNLRNRIQSVENINNYKWHGNIVLLITDQKDSIEFLFENEKIKSSNPLKKGKKIIGWI